MSFTREQIAQIEREREVVSAELQALWFNLVSEFAPSLTVGRAREYVCEGICRRLKIIGRCIDNIFAIFPVERKELLSGEELSDLQINLHAFVINIYGLLDNIAWVYIIEKSLEDTFKGGRSGVGLFNHKTRKHLPAEIRAYLDSADIKRWYTRYARNYRDALAHRIPLYVPPLTMTQTEGEQYRELENQRIAQLRKGDFERINALREEQKAIGSICAAFVHSYSDSDASSPVYFHPQVIADAKTVMEIVSVVRRHVP